MSDMDELEITIDAEGNVNIKVVCGEGTRCTELTKELEEALGVVEKRELLPEYHQEVEEVEEHVERQGG